MTQQTYPFVLPPLPYAYDALEPVISAETMHFHHDKHFAAYVEKLNAALKPYPHLHNLTLESLLAVPSRLPGMARCDILRNGGGVYNHALFFAGLAPQGTPVHHPAGQLRRMVDSTFGSFEDFKKAFRQQAMQVFGSGWTVLALSPEGRLNIMNLKNQDTLLCTRHLPLLYVDVWEHAYYLQYQNRRAEYLDAIWEVLRFPKLNLERNRLQNL